jgi:hypothetical protein
VAQAVLPFSAVFSVVPGFGIRCHLAPENKPGPSRLGYERVVRRTPHAGLPFVTFISSPGWPTQVNLAGRGRLGPDAKGHDVVEGE